MAFKKQIFNIQEDIKLFKFLKNNLSLSEARIQKYVAKGRFSINGKIIKKPFETIFGILEFTDFIPEPKGLKPIFETDEFAIFEKPFNVLIHPNGRNTNYSLTDDIKYLYGENAGVAHRIDKETSGLVLVYKNRDSEKILKKLFEDRKIKKEYLAIVKGNLQNEIFIDKAIISNKDFSKTKFKSIINKNGKKAQTIIKPIKYFKDKNLTLINATPLTGRTHQIRLHLYSINFPILGEPIYGIEFKITDRYLDDKLTDDERIKYTGANRLYLHSNFLGFKYKNIDYQIKSKNNFNL